MISKKRSKIADLVCFDGGGVKCLSEARFYQRLLKDYPKFKPYAFSGTSGGSIIAAGLAFGIDIADIVGLFVGHSSFIFKPKSVSFLQPVTDLVGPKYDIKNLLSVLNTVFGDKKIGESKYPLIIPSYSITECKTRVFSSLSKDDADIKAVDIIAASCAAPTYFSSHQIMGAYYVDGGLAANCPAEVCASVISKTKKIGRESMRIFSIGCGTYKKQFDVKSVIDGGKIAWAKIAIDLIFDATDDIIEQNLSDIFGDKFIRVQADRPSNVSNDLACASDDNIKNLLVFGDFMYESFKDRIHAELGTLDDK